MKKRSYRFSPSIVVFVLLFSSAVIWYQTDSLSSAFLDQIHKDMRERTELVRYMVSNLIRNNDKAVADELRRTAKVGGVRISLIDHGGKVIFDSEESPENLGNHLDRPEVMSALQGEFGKAVRFSETVGQNQIYAAARIDRPDGKPMVIRTGMSIQNLNNMIFLARRDLIMAGVFMALLILAFYLIIRRRISASVQLLKNQASAIAAGDLSGSIKIENGSRLILDLSSSLDRMLNNLKRQIRQLRLEKSKRDVIFASMGEGVIAVDNSGIIIDLNPAATQMLELPTLAVGLSLRGVIRCRKLEEFVDKVINRDPVSVIELTLDTVPPKYLRVRGTIMESENGAVGTVLVLSDITRLRKLENFRSDFIADVSHEIRTPLTAITGAVEALRDCGNDEPELTRPFMEMIIRQSERLNNLIKDILSISSLEYRGKAQSKDFAEINLAQSVRNAVELVKGAAEEQHIELLADIPDELRYYGDPQLLEQALYNLLENAVKYSGGSRIKISLKSDENINEIKVEDNGCGISTEHLPRIFERFYRVDK
ncbi:MAG: histidine kinase dimerization/phospho-acceptor domain-containing protein, partial [Victivallaceae bacterium]|nr:histidine kinase dimerization/phospho-acceptor domain-containing protein [Victivallaceae bacterium]